VRKKLMVGLMVAAILLSAAAPAGAAAGSATIESIGSQSAGASFLVKGTPATDTVMIQIFRPNHSLLLTDLLSSEQYAAGQSYTLPSDSAPGDYTVLAGSGQQSVATTFVVQAGGMSTPTPTPTPTPPPTGGATPAATPKIRPKQVTLEEIKQLLPATADAQGNKVLRLDANESGIQLPVSALGLAESVKLEVSYNQVRVQIPPSVLKQLIQLLPAGKTDSAQIVLEMGPVGATDAAKLLQAGEKSRTADIKLAGDVYELALSVSDGDSQTHVLSSFDQPLLLRFAYNAAANRDLLGVYHIADDGSLTYSGGRVDESGIEAEVHHFSKYAVLEYDKTFADVSATFWAHAVIQAMAAKHIIEGVSDTAFAPQESVTRAQFAAMLVRGLGLEASGQASFTDVSAQDWFAPYVAAAAANGIINGRTSSEFAPNEQVKREEMAVMVMRAYRLGHPAAETAAPSSSVFTDWGVISAWAQNDIEQAYRLGLIHGIAEGIFQPQGLTTRAESAQILYQLLYR